MANIKIYSTPSCVYCKMAKEFFGKNNLSYEDYNVVENMKAREEMIAKSHQMGVPVIDIDGQIIVGFDKDTLTKVLGIKG